jgi:hypothetical protein
MRHLAASVALALSLFAARDAHADPWFGAGDNALEDAFADGDIDEEDAIAMHVAQRPGR